MTAGTCHQTQKPSLMWLAVTFQAFQPPPPPPRPPALIQWYGETRNILQERHLKPLQQATGLFIPHALAWSVVLYNARNKVQWTDVTGQTATISLLIPYGLVHRYSTDSKYLNLHNEYTETGV